MAVKRSQTKVFADAGAVLPPQLGRELTSLARAIAPLAPKLTRKYKSLLRRGPYGKEQIEGLVAITPAAAATEISATKSVSSFLEIVEYRGRRLAKLGMNPVAVTSALRLFEEVLEDSLKQAGVTLRMEQQWAWNQLYFLTVLAVNTAFYGVREAESNTFYDLFRTEVEANDLAGMLPRFLDTLRSYTGAQAAKAFWSCDGGKTWDDVSGDRQGAPGGTIPVERARGKRLAIPQCDRISESKPGVALDPSWGTRFQTCWSVPFLAGQTQQGVLQFAFAKKYEWLPREKTLLSAAAERCWRAAEKARLAEDLAAREQQVRQLAQHMVEVEENERRRISRELHDEAGQSLLCMRLQLEMLEQDLPPESLGMRQRLSEVREITEHAILEIRRLIAALSPAILEQMGLPAALRQLVGRFRVVHPAVVHLQIPRRLELPKKVEILLYRLVQEIFNNIAKYSLATHVNLSVATADGMLSLHVEDDGVGFDVDEAFSRRDCYGLSGLRERVALLGGRLTVVSRRRELSGRAGEGASEPGGVSGESSKGKRRNSRKPQASGVTGVERQGTAISIELPLPRTTF